MVKVLLYLLLFFLPTQLGKHFWFDWSYKLGMRVDYLAPTVYLTDILAVVIILIFFGRKIANRARHAAPLRGQPQGLPLRLIGGIVILLMVGYWLFVVGENPWLLAYNLGRLGVLGLLGYIIAKTFKKEDFPQIITVLNWALILQVFLAAYQVTVEKSADLWILGERSFSILTPGIARFMAPGGQLLLRGYGTFGHPNVLAGFCLLMLAANAILFLGRFTPGGKEKSPSQGWCVGFVFSLLGIWLSMSILAIVISQAFLVCLGILVFGRTNRARHAAPLRLILLVVSVIILAAGIWSASWRMAAGNSDSISRRLVLLQYSWEMFKTSPVFGVGLGNFIPAMSEKPVGSTYFWQPVHNIPALVGVELGLAGIAGIALLMWLGVEEFKVQGSRFPPSGLAIPLGLFSRVLPAGRQVSSQILRRAGKARNQKSKMQIKNKISKKLPIINNSYFMILIAWWLIIFVTGLFDHYWLTLQQGRLMLVMVIGLTFVGASSGKKAR